MLLLVEILYYISVKKVKSSFKRKKHIINHHISINWQTLFQVLATTVVNLLTIDAGLIFALPGIVIPALTGILNEHNRNEFLTITAYEAAWMGMIKPQINSSFF